MLKDALKQYIEIRDSLHKERVQVQARLQQINSALQNEASFPFGGKRVVFDGNKKGKRKMTAEWRAKIAASARRRWKKAKAAGKNGL
jgi:hypothetical protein